MSKDRGVVKRAIVTPDKHVPLHDVLATSVVRQAIEIIQPDIYRPWRFRRMGECISLAMEKKEKAACRIYNPKSRERNRICQSIFR